MSSHSRKPSSRAVLPRRNTRGPLDADDPLPVTPATQSLSSSAVSQVRTESDVEPRSQEKIPATDIASNEPVIEEKDLSFLLEPTIYHPLSQLEVPTPFRRPFPQFNAALATISKISEEIEDKLSQCDYLGAAYLSGALLGSGLLNPTDQQRIFRCLQTRYSCLELSGNIRLAAQEAKALEDLSSAFYYVDLPPDEAAEEQAIDRTLPRHIMPFSLRLQALRLQSIGFSDPRRGIASLYDLGLECREHIGSPLTPEEDRQTWVDRLEQVGIRVVNALIEMGDLNCARRTLANMTSESNSVATWTGRKVLLCLKMGLITEAQKLIETSELQEKESALLRSLIAVADDRLDDAISIVTAQSPDRDTELMALAKQNAAVALLYKGEIQKARSLMETLIDEHESFSTLTVNLSTVLDLTSDQSRELKLAVADKIAADPKSRQLRTFTNADFKL